MNVPAHNTFPVIWLAPLLLCGALDGSPGSCSKEKPTDVQADTTRPVAVILEKSTIEPIHMIYIKDSISMSSLSKTFSTRYSELFKFIAKNKLKAGRVMAFYYTYSDPILLDIAVEVDKQPDSLAGNIQFRTIESCEALIAHYTGPYEQLAHPYKRMEQWLKDNNERANGLPFEVYLNDPIVVKDKYRLRTDIYQLLK